MRKPRDYDAELRSLEDKARTLKVRKVQQLGELVVACGADALGLDELAGALIVIVETKDPAKREAWAKRGAAFFQGRLRDAAQGAGGDAARAASPDSAAQPPERGQGTH